MSLHLQVTKKKNREKKKQRKNVLPVFIFNNNLFMQCPLLTQTSTVTSSNEQINRNKINASEPYYDTIYCHLLFIEPEYHALCDIMWDTD